MMDIATDTSRMKMEPSLDGCAMAAVATQTSAHLNPNEGRKVSKSQRSNLIRSNDPTLSNNPGAAVLMIPALRVHDETTTLPSRSGGGGGTSHPMPSQASASPTFQYPHQHREVEPDRHDSSRKQPGVGRKRVGMGLIHCHSMRHGRGRSLWIWKVFFFQ
jgi:hypothetical protein